MVLCRASPPRPPPQVEYSSTVAAMLLCLSSMGQQRLWIWLVAAVVHMAYEVLPQALVSVPYRQATHSHASRDLQYSKLHQQQIDEPTYSNPESCRRRRRRRHRRRDRPALRSTRRYTRDRMFSTMML